MSLLLALCGPKEDLAIREVPLDNYTQMCVQDLLMRQEADFRRGHEVPFDQNWRGESGEIMTTRIPENVTVFDTIRDRITDTSVEPVDVDEEAISHIRGFTMKLDTNGRERILVQNFIKSQRLTRPGRLSLIVRGYEEGTFTRLEESAFHLDDRLVCIVEEGMIKFRNRAKLGRIINTSGIVKAATNKDVRSFAKKYTGLFDVADLDVLTRRMNIYARQYMASIEESGALRGHTPRTLQNAARDTRLRVQINDDGKIEMPMGRGEITEFFRFLNDGRYVGPISRQTYIAGSRRPVTSTSLSRSRRTRRS